MAGGRRTSMCSFLLSTPRTPSRLCADLERAVDIGVSIVDLNDYGGSIRAVSPRSLVGRDAGRCSVTTRYASDSPARHSSSSGPLTLTDPWLDQRQQSSPVGSEPSVCRAYDSNVLAFGVGPTRGFHLRDGRHDRRRRATTSMASASSRRSGARSAYKTPMKTASKVSPTAATNNASLNSPEPRTGPSR